jgi:hypothetical protein
LCSIRRPRCYFIMARDATRILAPISRDCLFAKNETLKETAASRASQLSQSKISSRLLGRLQSFCHRIFNLVMILYCFGSTKYTSSGHIPGATDVTNHISKTTVYTGARRRCIDSRLRNRKHTFKDSTFI